VPADSRRACSSNGRLQPATRSTRPFKRNCNSFERELPLVWLTQSRRCSESACPQPGATRAGPRQPKRRGCPHCRRPRPPCLARRCNPCPRCRRSKRVGRCRREPEDQVHPPVVDRSRPVAQRGPPQQTRGRRRPRTRSRSNAGREQDACVIGPDVDVIADRHATREIELRDHKGAPHPGRIAPPKRAPADDCERSTAPVGRERPDRLPGHLLVAGRLGDGVQAVAPGSYEYGRSRHANESSRTLPCFPGGRRRIERAGSGATWGSGPVARELPPKGAVMNKVERSPVLPIRLIIVS
jgi:hypothetical protein